MQARSPRYGMPQRAPRKQRRVWLWLLALIPLGIVASLGLVIALGVVFNATGTELEPSPQERELVLDIEALSNWLDGAPSTGPERLTKRRYIDRSYEIEYVYDVPDDDTAPYLSYTLTFEPKKSDARTSYLSYWGGTRIGFYMFGEVEIAIDERNEVFSWGDESRFGILTADGIPFGNVFVARRDKQVVYLLLTGVYFDETEAISELLLPHLERLDTYSPEV